MSCNCFRLHRLFKGKSDLTFELDTFLVVGDTVMRVERLGM